MPMVARIHPIDALAPATAGAPQLDHGLVQGGERADEADELAHGATGEGRVATEGSPGLAVRD